jgi:uncharacterized RDD family membrane protein YckC
LRTAADDARRIDPPSPGFDVIVHTAPRLWIRVSIILYDGLLLFGVLFVAGLAFELATGYRGEVGRRLWFQAYCAGIIAAYFIWFWTRHGQTLAMRAWRTRLIAANGARLTWRQAGARFLLAALGWTLAGLTLWWSLFDRDRQYLHDRLGGTRLTRS